MKVRFLDLSVRDQEKKDRLLAAVGEVLTHGQIVLGPEVSAFESRMASYCSRHHAVGVSSGTEALYIALRALNIGPGDEVITTPLSWIATLNAIILTGATPVFVDIAPDLNLNADLVTEAITPRTKAIVPVHYTGRVCDMDKINALAKRHGLQVVEDAAQAFGAEWTEGRKAGSLGDVACFSMNSMKVYHSYGEAGVILTDDMALKDKMMSLRYGGTINREDCHFPSLNFRIHTIQAALLLVEIDYLEAILARRRAIAQYYDTALSGVADLPLQTTGTRHGYYTYTIQADRRDALKEYLASRGIETKIHHPFLMPYHTAYKGRFQPNIPVAEHLLQRVLCIPNHEKLTDGELEYVADSVKAFYGQNG